VLRSVAEINLERIRVLEIFLNIWTVSQSIDVNEERKDNVDYLLAKHTLVGRNIRIERVILSLQ
jgi:hypothetical protein